MNMAMRIYYKFLTGSQPFDREKHLSFAKDFGKNIYFDVLLFFFFQGLLASLDDERRIIFANRHLCTKINAEGKVTRGVVNPG